MLFGGLFISAPLVLVNFANFYTLFLPFVCLQKAIFRRKVVFDKRQYAEIPDAPKNTPLRPCPVFAIIFVKEPHYKERFYAEKQVLYEYEKKWMQ